MKNIHILPTDKPSSKLIKHKVFNEVKISSLKNLMYWDNVNIYITNDSEIKEGDYIFETDTNKVNIADKDYYRNEFDFKIILTTDPQLIQDGVQAIDDEFLEWFVKNLSCEEVDVKDITTIPALQLGSPNGHLMYKIIIPQEEPKQTDEKGNPLTYWGGLEEPKQKLPIINGSYGCTIETDKQETLEEAAEKWYDSTEENKGFSKIKAFKEGAKWQAERMYSEKEVIDLLQEMNDWPTIFEGRIDIREWFEQFKKK
jgi:hypothetical protein